MNSNWIPPPLQEISRFSAVCKTLQLSIVRSVIQKLVCPPFLYWSWLSRVEADIALKSLHVKDFKSPHFLSLGLVLKLSQPKLYYPLLFHQPMTLNEPNRLTWQVYLGRKATLRTKKHFCVCRVNLYGTARFNFD